MKPMIVPIADVPNYEEIFLTWVKWVVIDQDGEPVGGYRTKPAAERAMIEHTHSA